MAVGTTSVRRSRSWSMHCKLQTWHRGGAAVFPATVFGTNPQRGTNLFVARRWILHLIWQSWWWSKAGVLRSGLGQEATIAALLHDVGHLLGWTCFLIATKILAPCEKFDEHGGTKVTLDLKQTLWRSCKASAVGLFREVLRSVRLFHCRHGRSLKRSDGGLRGGGPWEARWSMAAEPRFLPEGVRFGGPARGW